MYGQIKGTEYDFIFSVLDFVYQASPKSFLKKQRDIFKNQTIFFTFGVHINRTMKHPFLIIALICINLCPAFTKEQFVYSQVSHNEGLTSAINCIFKENDGNVWICSRNGLYKFNGDFLHQFTGHPFEGKKVNKVSLDAEGNLWVLTDQGLLIRKSEYDDFTEMNIPDCSSCNFQSISYDNRHVWLGCEGSIYRYTYADDSLSRFVTTQDSSFLFKDMHMLHDDKMLCCSPAGIMIVNKKTGDHYKQTHKLRELSASLMDSKGRLWLAFYNSGVEVYDISSGKLIKSYKSGNSALTNDIIFCMTERNGIIWAGTDGGGINMIDLDNDRISVLSSVSGDPSSLPALSIKSIHTDRHGNIWAGSTRKGLICISPSKMNSYTDVHFGMTSGLSNPTVLSIHQEAGEEYIWIGTDGGGINRFDPSTYEFTHYPSTKKAKVVSIAPYSKDELAISIHADRIWLFNKNTGTLRALDIKDEEVNYKIAYSGTNINLHREPSGSMLLISSMVRRLNTNTLTCSKIAISDGKNSQGNISIIGQTTQGLWMHDNSSIYLLADGESQMHRITTCDNNKINSGHIGPDGIMWLATSNGLYKYDRIENKLNHLQTSLIKEISSVVCDRSGRVWIGTDKQLFAYLKTSESFALFGISDGVMSNEFLGKPKLLSKNGDVYMGGVQGLLKIDPDYMIDSEENPQLHLYEFRVDGDVLHKDSDRFHVPGTSHSISISVATHEKDMFREKLYRFQFSGSTQEIITSRPSLVLNQLPAPGKYDVLVSCSKRNGEWSEPTNILTMRIPRPWYRSWWFITATIALITGVFFLITYSFRQRKEHQKQLTQKQQEQFIYEDKLGLLINISHELRTPLTLVMAPLKRLLSTMTPSDDNFSTLTRIYRQSRRMKDLLNMVLDLRKMELGESQLKIEGVNLNVWILDTIEDFINEEHEEGISVKTELDPNAPLVDLDRQKCETILTNLLINAIKHSQAGQTITLSTEYIENEDIVKISVKDEGPGIKDLDPAKLFTRFYKNGKYSNGIGLSYSKILVERLGGRIGAENNPGCGSTFWWTLPVHNIPTEESSPSKDFLNELADPGKDEDMEPGETMDSNTMKSRIMLVDDNQDLLDFLQESLGSYFKEIITATGGDMALQMISTGKRPDLIVSDVNMPDGDGYTLCKALKSNEKFSHIPVILLTALSNTKSQNDSYRAGADASLSKPFEIDTLMEVIKSQLRHKEDIRKRYLDNKGESEKAYYSSDEEAFIIKFNKVISENLGNPELDQHLLCRELGISRAALYNKMRAITGSGAKEYITRIRIEKAKDLILTTKLPVADISEQTGFTSQSYFSTAFKAYTGLTPSQFKQQHKASHEE